MGPCSCTDSKLSSPSISNYMGQRAHLCLETWLTKSYSHFQSKEIEFYSSISSSKQTLARLTGPTLFYCQRAAFCMAWRCLVKTEERLGTKTACYHEIFWRWLGVKQSRLLIYWRRPEGRKSECFPTNGLATLWYSYSLESLCREERLDERFTFDEGLSSIRGELFDPIIIELSVIQLEIQQLIVKAINACYCKQHVSHQPKSKCDPISSQSHSPIKMGVVLGVEMFGKRSYLYFFLQFIHNYYIFQSQQFSSILQVYTQSHQYLFAEQPKIFSKITVFSTLSFDSLLHIYSILTYLLIHSNKCHFFHFPIQHHLSNLILGISQSYSEGSHNFFQFLIVLLMACQNHLLFARQVLQIIKYHICDE